MDNALRIGAAALLLTGAAVVVTPASATMEWTPARHTQGDSTYITGGVGERDAKRFEALVPRHRLAIEVLEHAGSISEFTAGAGVKIDNVRGKTVLDARADGPFMLVDLPPGRYSVAATLAGHGTERKAVVVGTDKVARVTFDFPAWTGGQQR